jgi:hypothetical protein
MASWEAAMMPVIMPLPIEGLDCLHLTAVRFLLVQLLDGETLGEAMREARRQMRKNHPDSATWATFMLYGDPTFRL